MKKLLVTILILVSIASGCCKESSKSSEPSLFSSDQTKEAGELVLQANDDLKKVKAIYKANKNRADDLKKAMSEKNVEEVKSIANDLVLQINDGLVSGESAFSKIEKAEEMDINSTYKDYLDLKKDSLRKHLDAFELRRQVAQLLRDSFGGKDPKEIDKAQLIFREKEDAFQKLIDDAKDLSKQANDLYEESMNKK